MENCGGFQVSDELLVLVGCVFGVFQACEINAVRNNPSSTILRLGVETQQRAGGWAADRLFFLLQVGV